MGFVSPSDTTFASAMTASPSIRFIHHFHTSSIVPIIYIFAGEEPKLLGRVDSTVSSSTSAAFDIHKSNITSYAFLDDGSKVRLYVDLPGIQDACAAESASGDEGIEPAKVNLEWTETSMCLLITNYPKTGDSNRCLSFGRLHGAIEKGMVKTKKDRLVVTLVKKGKEVESKEVTGDGEEGSNNVDVDEPQYEEWPSIAAKD